MLQEYISRELLAKNRSVYFKKGKWIFHLICLLAFWLISFLQFRKGIGLVGRQPGVPSGQAALAAVVEILPFYGFFFVYCLYLIPVCFKRRRYRRFWVLLGALLLVMPWIDQGVNLGLRHLYPGILKPSEHSGWKLLFITYRDFLTAFLGFTTVLFLMELVEGVRTAKETQRNAEVLGRTEVQLLKTRMNPDFINRSLDDIIRLSGSMDPEAPDAVVRFADLLRYRLYRSHQPRVRLDEELQQLGNLFSLQHSLPAGQAMLEIDGRSPQAAITPMLLLNIAEPLLAAYREQDGWSLHFYILAEETALQIAIELSSPDPRTRALLETVRSETERICGATLTFAIEQSQTDYSIRICLPLLPS